MKLLRKPLYILLLLTVFFAVSTTGVSAAMPNVSASAAVVMDTTTDAFFYAKDADTLRPAASMTKLMTAYVVFEEIAAGHLDYDTPLTVSAKAAAFSLDPEYSNVPLVAGETQTVDTLLKVLLLPSACAAGTVFAESISGSEAAFALRMNEEAAKLGLTAHFVSSHGGFEDAITPRSMALLSAYLVEKYPIVLKYTSLKSVVFKERTYVNTNRFLSSDYYAGVDGLKTGSTSAAGACLTTSATKNGRRLITVVMHSANSAARYSDSRPLLDYGFERLPFNDLALAASDYELTGETEKIRAGADFTVDSTVLRGTDFSLGGSWTVNGVTVAPAYGENLNPGTAMSYCFDLRQCIGTDVTIGFVVKQPDGFVKVKQKVFSFSDETPCAFRDINGHWSEAAITALKDKAVLNGYEDGKFQPENTITRGEFTTALMRLMAQQGKVTIIAGAQSGFTDTNGHWADSYIAAARHQGIAKGYADNSFSPNDKISRQEIAALLYRAYELKATNTAKVFIDEEEIADWAKEAVNADVANGLINGYPDGSFGPQKDAKRSEAATMFYKASLLP